MARERDQERAYFERLLIKPVFSPLSSSGGSSSRSPREEHRVALKIETIDYYGLWASAEADKTARTVRTMLASSAAETEPAPVPFREAILAHIWPSALAICAQDAGGLFGLPEAFHVTPRNFLILRKPVERAFDVDALLLLPRRTAGGEQQVASRLFRRHVSRLPEAERAMFAPATATSSPAAAPICTSDGYDGRLLFLPRASEGRVPFMHLLAWKAVSALRAAHEDIDAQEGLPADLDLDATDTSGAATRAGSAAAKRLTSAGVLFLRP